MSQETSCGVWGKAPILINFFWRILEAKKNSIFGSESFAPRPAPLRRSGASAKQFFPSLPAWFSRLAVVATERLRSALVCKDKSEQEPKARSESLGNSEPTTQH